mgnify:CR=1 FL=1
MLTGSFEALGKSWKSEYGWYESEQEIGKEELRDGTQI